MAINFVIRLTKFIRCRDELESVSITIADDDLAGLALLGLPKSWQWEGEATRLGETLVGFGTRRIQVEYQGWILIQDR